LISNDQSKAVALPRTRRVSLAQPFGWHAEPTIVLSNGDRKSPFVAATIFCISLHFFCSPVDPLEIVHSQDIGM